MVPTDVPAPRKTKTRRSNTGAPTYLTPETTQSLVETLRIGNHLSTACDYVGIGKSTVFLWLARGRKEQARIEAMRSEGVEAHPEPREVPYVEFLEAITRAQAYGETVAVGTIRSAMSATQFVRDGEGNLVEVPDYNVRERAAKDFLERRHKDKWARGEFVEQVVETEITAKVEVTVEQQRQRMETILAEAIETGVFDAAQAALGDGTGEQAE